MRVAVTGTPGTGKTSATEALERNGAGASDGDGVDDVDDVKIIHLNDHVETDDLYTSMDESRDSLVADLEGIEAWLDEREKAEDGKETGTLLVESHLAHLLPVDRVVVLRCHPKELKRRLDERGAEESKASENTESEALDVILSETVSRHGTENVYEIDTTDRTPTEVSEAIAAVVVGERAPSAGTVSFLDYLG
ncbi:adenylate kinase [Halobacteriales archaeon QS_3_64_16]|nr:MAG: adenylate kinase [Halobacteriales archaeon QS_3_64_16]